MSNIDKAKYFDENIISIFDNDEIELLDFIKEFINDPDFQNTLKNWPREIKEIIVDKHKISLNTKDYRLQDEDSWSEFYEMYDGKFDEKHMLHITIKAQNKSDIINLGYIAQSEEDDWHKPEAGEYKSDDEGNLVLIHSCPDIEIFGMDINQYLEELNIKSDWTVDKSFSTM